jgi:hypothetical protein
MECDTLLRDQETIREVVQSVLVVQDYSELRISRNALRAILLNGQRPGPSCAAPTRREAQEDLILLKIDAMPERCGREIRLVGPPGVNGQRAARHAPALLKAVARAHDWHGRTMSGKAWDQRSLAKLTGLDEVYVGRILACAFLAPDIVEAILEGHQPFSLTVGKLQKNLAMNWAEQRRQLCSPDD